MRPLELPLFDQCDPSLKSMTGIGKREERQRGRPATLRQYENTAALGETIKKSPFSGACGRVLGLAQKPQWIWLSLKHEDRARLSLL
jgi:hypothetical protein